MNEPIKSAVRWWEDTHKPDREQAVFAAFRALREANKRRTEDNLWFARLYGARAYEALRPRAHHRTSAFDRVTGMTTRPQLTFNLIQSVVDTKVAKLAGNTPRAMFITEGGSWEKKQAAKKLTKASDGLAYETKLASKELDALLDEEVMGGGVIHIYDDGQKVHAERVLPDEILVDEEEAFYGDPQTMMRWKTMPRDRAVALAKRMADNAADVDESAITTSCGDPDDTSSAESTVDLVLVVEAWHLPSGPGEGDGRHVICVEKSTLCDEGYEDDEFPFAILIGQKRQVGFWGQGAAERLMPTQWHLNKLYETIENMLEHGAVTRILRRRGAKIPDSHIRRRKWGMDVIDVEAGPQDITVVAPNPVPKQLLDREETLIQRGYMQEGVSEMDAAAVKPAGLDSAPAQREYHDIASQRFMRLGKAFEQFHLDCIRLMLKRAKRLAEAETEEAGKKKKRGYKVRVPTGKAMETVDLSSIDLPEDGYIMQAFPVSALPTTPAAKRAELAEWVSMEWIDGRAAMKLMNMPDLEDHASLQAAALDDIEATIGEMLDHGRPQTPEPYQDLAEGLKWVQLAYLRARREKAPEERLDLLREWMAQAKAMLDGQAAEEAAMAPPPAISAGPPMPPGAPPAPQPMAADPNAAALPSPDAMPGAPMA